MNKDVIAANFAQSFRGSAIGRNHLDYEEVRKLYNAITDKRAPLRALRARTSEPAWA
jgi:hypothetical protein